MADYTLFKLRGNTRANWLADNPVLNNRELAMETDTMRFKVGDGLATYSQLPYGRNTGEYLNFYNVTAFLPLPAGYYYTHDTAISNVVANERCRGLIVTYEVSSGVWYTERFIGTDVANWGVLANWEQMPDSSDFTALHDVITAYNNHAANTSNPHSVTKEQIGLLNVDNTSDLNKPISTATQNALDNKVNVSGDQTIYGVKSFYTSPTVPNPTNNNDAVNKATLDLHKNDSTNPHQVTKAQVGLGNADNTSDTDKPISSATQTALNLKENTASKGAVNGYASLDETGKVPAGQLPSYVDDVLEYANLASFPVSGVQGKIYVALDTNKTYRWSGSAYIYITSGAVDSVAGKTGVVSLVKGDVGLGNVDNTSDANKPVSTAQQTALNIKADKARQVIAGSGLAGGGDLSADRTINVGATDDSIIVAADGIKVDTQNSLTSTSITKPLAANQGKVLDEKITQVGADLNTAKIELGLNEISVVSEKNLGNTYYILAESGSIYTNASFNTSVCYFPIDVGKKYSLDVPITGNAAMAVVAYATSVNQINSLTTLGYIGNNAHQTIEFIAGNYAYVAVCYTTSGGVPILKTNATKLSVRVASNEAKITSLDNSVASINDNLITYDYVSASEVYEVTNYGLFVDIIADKKYNKTTGQLESSTTFNSTTLAVLDKEYPIYMGVSGVINLVLFFDKDRNYISCLTGKYLTVPVLVSEYPSSAVYVAFSYYAAWIYGDTFYTMRENKPQYGNKLYSTIKKIKGSRPIVNIYTTDTENQILVKLINALLTKDCDVYWENGNYNFQQVYLDMVDIYAFGKVGGSWQRELPLGGNCRYFLNGSTITGSLPTGITDAKVFGTIRSADCPFELKDGTIICQGMVYCIHDEGQGYAGYYSHTYENLIMYCYGGTRCIGGGTGLFGEAIIKNCEFHNDGVNAPDVAYHGITNSTTDVANFKVSILNSWFSYGAQVNTLSQNQKGKLIYCGNSAAVAPIILNAWDNLIWNNVTR